MVPYERNQYFTGRDAFLKQLFDQFRDSTTTHYHGRLALFGLGGIGKTQAALEFTYRYQDFYSRIYWISAVSQESLLDGYGKIAKQAELQIQPDTKPIEIADQVLSWLKQDQNWLIVLDNLDDINILSTKNLGGQNIRKTLLLECGPQQHTLITTRNSHADNIPAQAVEVTLFDKLESIDLLASLSNIVVLSDSTEQKYAEQIVEELGYLPLAIVQAAAYIKEVSGNFCTFLEDYREYRQRLNRWIPQGLWSYQHSVATTWAMSFDTITTDNLPAAKLFQLLSFLNPDGILIDFLRTGANALRKDLQQLVSNKIELSEALLILERFSLLKWDRLNKTLVVHRLVQAFVKDRMSAADLKDFSIMVAEICDTSFPENWDTLKNWEQCRVSINQIMRPLFDQNVAETLRAVSIMDRVGWFLRDDGKIMDSVRILELSLAICSKTLGEDHPDTLTTKANLASTYRAQGRTAEAASLGEEVLEKQRQEQVPTV